MSFKRVIQNIEFSPEQWDFFFSKAKFPAFVGGRGSGKSFCLTMKCVFETMTYGVDAWMCAPTYVLLHDITIPNMFKALQKMNIDFKFNGAHNEITLPKKNKIKFRSLEHPKRLVGSEVGFMGFDELDTMDPKKAADAWGLAGACLRQKGGGNPQACVTTTPEGLQFVYEQWVEKIEIAKTNLAVTKNKLSEYEKHEEIFELAIERLVAMKEDEERFLKIESKMEKLKDNSQELSPLIDDLNNICEILVDYKIRNAPTASNSKNLPHDYIRSLTKLFSAHQLPAYLEGRFAPMLANLVYPCFNRNENYHDEVLRNRDTVHIGVDFNVGKTCGIVLRIDSRDRMFVVDEILNCLDTPALIHEIRNRYPQQRIFVYPDASGASRKSVNASFTDIMHLENAGFEAIYDQTNPAVKDRINCVNNCFEKKKLFVNSSKCPTLTKCLEQQSYDKFGKPDKSRDLDHPLDALGYAIVKNSELMSPKSFVINF